MMIWKSEKWKMVYERANCQPRGGMHLRFDKGVHPAVKSACKDFCKWLRREYVFPVRVPVHICRHIGLRCRDGDIANGTCFWPDERREEPYIRIASGRFDPEREWDWQFFKIFEFIAHELTHYFQWINGLEYTDIGRERQAKVYAERILEAYEGYYVSPGNGPCNG